jgi:hypothetical protein
MRCTDIFARWFLFHSRTREPVGAFTLAEKDIAGEDCRRKAAGNFRRKYRSAKQLQ